MFGSVLENKSIRMTCYVRFPLTEDLRSISIGGTDPVEARRGGGELRIGELELAGGQLGGDAQRAPTGNG